MQLFQFLHVFFLVIFCSKYTVADKSFRQLSVATENEDLSIRPSSLQFIQGKLKIDSPDVLLRDTSEKHLTNFPQCAISPDSNGHVNIPEDWTGIDDWAFYHCLELNSISIPANVTYIGASAFGRCYSLTEVNFSPGSYLTTIRNDAFQSSGLLSITIPASVISIGESAFRDCSSLTSVTFSPGSTLTTFVNAAFQSSGLLSITIPASVTGIGEGVFRYCSSLTVVIFSSGSVLTNIGYAAFQSSGLLSITLPASVVTIGESAFRYCSSLTEVIFSPGFSLTVFGNGAFGDNINFKCLDPDVPFNVTTLCRSSTPTRPPTSCPVHSIGLPTGDCGCLRGFHNVAAECIPCQVGHSTLQGGDECIAAKIVSVLAEKKCRGYKSIGRVLPPNSVSIRYISSSEEKMLVFSDVSQAFLDTVSAVEARFMISHHKVSVGGNSFPIVLSKKQDYYDQRYLLTIPSHTNQTFFDLSFPSCVDHLLDPGQYISKLRLIFYGVPPESMLTFDTIVGCKDFYFDPSSTFAVNEGVCINNPNMFE